MNTIVKQQSFLIEEPYEGTQVLKKQAKSSPQVRQSVRVSPLAKHSLDELFPEQEYEEKAVKRAKEILGLLSDEFTAEQLKDVVAEVQFLVSTWLDDFEKNIFDGLTLQELLHEKGEA